MLERFSAVLRQEILSKTSSTILWTSAGIEHAANRLGSSGSARFSFHLPWSSQSLKTLAGVQHEVSILTVLNNLRDLIQYKRKATGATD